MPGVDATTAAVVEGGSLFNGSELSAVFVDPASYAAVIDRAPGPSFPRPRSRGPAGAAGGGRSGGRHRQRRPADRQHHPRYAAAAGPRAHPAGATASGPEPVSLTVADGATTILIQVAGQIGGVPAVAPDAVVLPLRALGAAERRART